MFKKIAYRYHFRNFHHRYICPSPSDSCDPSAPALVAVPATVPAKSADAAKVKREELRLKQEEARKAQQEATKAKLEAKIAKQEGDWTVASSPRHSVGFLASRSIDSSIAKSIHFSIKSFIRS